MYISIDNSMQICMFFLVYHEIQSDFFLTIQQRPV
jgi:hypothetical protein